MQRNPDKAGIRIRMLMAVAVCSSSGFADGIGPGIEPVDLKCGRFGGLTEIPAAKPRLSWRIHAPEKSRGVRQTAYRILVAPDINLLDRDRGDLWDSGRVEGDRSLDVEYAGKALDPGGRFFWKVKTFTTAGDSWSRPSCVTMGLPDAADWKAKWISVSRWFMEPRFRPPGWMAVGTPSWAQIDLGGRVRIDSIRLYPNQPGDFPARFRIEADDDAEFNHPEVLADHTHEDFRIGERKMVEFPGNGITAGHIRILITAARNGAQQSVVRQMEVMSGGRNVALMRPTIESGHHWHTGHAMFMVDGMPSANDGASCPEDACPTHVAPLLRKTFVLEQPVTRAVLHYAAHGMADVSINGKRTDDSVVGPRFSDYGKRIHFRTLDVTGLLNKGGNVIGVTLGNGFFSPPGRGFGERHNGNGQPRLRLQLEAELADGSRRVIVSDESWRWSRGEIVFNDLWNGYVEDRRLAKPGWDKPGYPDESWRGVAVVESMGGKMCASDGPVPRVIGSMKPDRVVGNDAFFDTLSAGWPRLEIKNGKAGQTIALRGDSGVPCQFTLAADGPAVLEPRFVWGSGPLKLTVTGLGEPLARENVSIQQVGADFRMTGSFHCSNPWLNELHQAVLRTHRNYCLDYPLDPMREKQGWTQDAQNFFHTAAYLTDVPAFYREWWRDMADNQRSNGLTGSIMPLMGQMVDDWNCPWWSGMIVWLPWEHYLYYGDRSFLEEAYEPMRRYVDYLDRIAALGAGTRALDHPDPRYFLNADAARERLLIWSGASDWQHPDGQMASYAATPTGPLVNMAAWYHYANVVSRTALLLGKKADAEKYAAVARDVAKRTNQKYLDSSTGRYGASATDQTAQILPLAVGMVPQEVESLTCQRLLEAIEARKGRHAAGFVALPYLLQILSERRESAVANRMINQTEYPSWRTMIHHGVMAEGWNGGGAQMPSCGGAVGMWLYQSVLGIRPDPAGPGFKKFILAPQPDPATGLTSAEGSYESPYGRIVSQWKIESERMFMSIVVPPNTTATVYVPAKNEADVTESGKPAAASDGVKFLRMEKDAAVFEVVSGTYGFLTVK